MNTRALTSRNKREGKYAGWRISGGRGMLNDACRQFNHQRYRPERGLLVHWKDRG